MAHGDTRIIPLELQESYLPVRVEELALAPRIGLRVDESTVPWRELAAGIRTGRVSEAVALGTGIGIADITAFCDGDRELSVRGVPVAAALRRELGREHTGAGQHHWLSPA